MATRKTKVKPIEALIHVVRGQKVVLDADLAILYSVETKQINRAVKRNLNRFPSTFMFRLTKEESLRCQIGTSNDGRGGRRYLPYVFTEHGVVMLSSVLNSDKAVEMSILVVNAFIRMRELIASNKDLAARVEKLENGQDRTASVIEILVEDIDRIGAELKQMKALPPARKRKIGF
ncbi:MAG: ORF6N domain-containing protein [Acidobacteria bacterium]|nr:ORF6N domain-containing protein [Acidobacteriota bacterium]